MIQKRGLAEADFRGERFEDHHGQLKGNNDLLCLTRPDIVAELHDAYFAAGADIAETNTFTATAIAQADYGLRRRGARHQPRRRAHRPRGRRPLDGEDAGQAALRRRLHRPAQPHAVDVVRRERSRRAPGDLRPGLRRLPRAGAGAARGRGRPLPDRDHHRHAELQGRDQGDPRSAGRGPGAAADLDLAAPSPTAPAARCRARRSRRSGTRCATPGRSPSASTARWAPS